MVCLRVRVCQSSPPRRKTKNLQIALWYKRIMISRTQNEMLKKGVRVNWFISFLDSQARELPLAAQKKRKISKLQFGSTTTTKIETDENHKTNTSKVSSSIDSFPSRTRTHALRTPSRSQNEKSPNCTLVQSKKGETDYDTIIEQQKIWKETKVTDVRFIPFAIDRKSLVPVLLYSVHDI